MIETGEVVHVPVRDEDVADAQQLARRQPGDVAEVEEKRPALERRRPPVPIEAGRGFR
jgi:hypothetical protein